MVLCDYTVISAVAGGPDPAEWQGLHAQLDNQVVAADGPGAGVGYDFVSHALLHSMT